MDLVRIPVWMLQDVPAVRREDHHDEGEKLVVGDLAEPAVEIRTRCGRKAGNLLVPHRAEIHLVEKDAELIVFREFAIQRKRHRHDPRLTVEATLIAK